MPWDSVDRPRDEDRVETCVCCGESAAAREPDARMPNLAVASCWPCRDRIAYEVGWMFFRSTPEGSLWRKLGHLPVRLPSRNRKRRAAA